MTSVIWRAGWVACPGVAGDEWSTATIGGLFCVVRCLLSIMVKLGRLTLGCLPFELYFKGSGYFLVIWQRVDISLGFG